jgi:hypothetical protein
MASESSSSSSNKTKKRGQRGEENAKKSAKLLDIGDFRERTATLEENLSNSQHPSYLPGDFGKLTKQQLVSSFSSSSSRQADLMLEMSWKKSSKDIQKPTEQVYLFACFMQPNPNPPPFSCLWLPHKNLRSAFLSPTRSI